MCRSPDSSSFSLAWGAWHPICARRNAVQLIITPLEEPFLSTKASRTCCWVSNTTSASSKPCQGWGSTLTLSFTSRHQIAEGWWHLPAHTRSKPGVSHRRQTAPGSLQAGQAQPFLQCQRSQPDLGALTTKTQHIPHPATKSQSSAAEISPSRLSCCN